jgi:DNA-binding CsgD family transcriptional regulator
MQFERSNCNAYAVREDGAEYSEDGTFSRQAPRTETDTLCLSLLPALEWVETENDLRIWLTQFLLPQLRAEGILLSLGEIEGGDHWRQAAMINQALPEEVRDLLCNGVAGHNGDGPVMTQLTCQWLRCRRPVAATLKLATGAKGELLWLTNGEAAARLHRVSVAPPQAAIRPLQLAGRIQAAATRTIHIADEHHSFARVSERPQGTARPPATSHTLLLHGATEPAGRRGIFLFVVQPACADFEKTAGLLAALGPILPKLYCKTAGILLRRRRSTDEPAPPATADDLKQLSAAELEVLEWVAKGKSNWEIAKILGRAEGTVKNQVSSILARLRLTARADAGQWYRRRTSHTIVQPDLQ